MGINVLHSWVAASGSSEANRKSKSTLCSVVTWNSMQGTAQCGQNARQESGRRRWDCEKVHSVSCPMLESNIDLPPITLGTQGVTQLEWGWTNMSPHYSTHLPKTGIPWHPWHWAKQGSKKKKKESLRSCSCKQSSSCICSPKSYYMCYPQTLKLWI